jgi:glycosyltransferase involved in cell wall biosynthesis
MQVTYFHRQPRPQANFSIEQVFQGVRQELAGRIDARVCVAPCFSNGLFRRLWIALHARRHQVGINHVTGDTNFTALALDGKRTVLTNHDCGYIQRTSGLRRWLLGLFWLKLPVRHVAAVTTVSSQIKEEIIRFSGCPPEKVHVIPNAVSCEFKPVEKAFNATCPRILHIGTAINKNLPRVIEAVAGLRCTLVIVGRIGEDVRRQLADAQVEYENCVNLTAREVVREYEECELVVFASLYEGFGLPIIEAQAVGRAVLTSNRLPMSEVAGDGACLVDPTDAQAIRLGIDRIIFDATYRERLVESGFENVKRFQQERIAEQYLRLYENVLARANCSATVPVDS